MSKSILDIPEGLDARLPESKGGFLRGLITRFSNSSNSIIGTNNLEEGVVGYDVENGEIKLRYPNSKFGEKRKRYGIDILPIDTPTETVVLEYKILLSELGLGHRKRIKSVDRFLEYFEADSYSEAYHGHNLLCLHQGGKIGIEDFRKYVCELLEVCLDGVIEYIRNQQVSEEFLSSFDMEILEWGLVKGIINFDQIPTNFCYQELGEKHIKGKTSARIENHIFGEILPNRLTGVAGGRQEVVAVV